MNKAPEHSGGNAPVVVMGVAGSGKTLVGRQLAEEVCALFIEGDQFHPPSNVALMASGTALNDENRKDWLDRIGRRIAEMSATGQRTVTACSALKRIYRDRLRGYCPDIVFLYLDIDQEIAEQRVAARHDHFMPASLVRSQFEALDPPGEDERALGVDATLPVTTIVAKAIDYLGS
ncbi:gluconokinase [Mesorhizobium sp. L-8-10]|uniref:gluconokinase n=1 Tax=Mesorhizobium sp. L-8-10 TaxID=2744523 RepID=UPI0019263FFE|nr:gluconokinase [Mesorhizobium sp. L-8-10]BCH33482.1 gluconokinase [Mesorhizobium sp. L-8-10]